MIASSPGAIAFTVVIPAYNPGALLRESLISVAGQIERPAWVVVIDDGSSDNSADLARAALVELGLAGQVIEQRNQGISAARNAGLAERKTEWVALLDADDLWLPDHLQRLGAAIGHCPDAVVAFGDSEYFGEPDVPRGRIARARARSVVASRPAADVTILSDRIFDALLPGLFIPVSASAFRPDVDGREMRFDPELRTGEDRYLFLRFAQRGRFVFVDHQTARTRRHANNTTHHSQEARRHHDLLTLLIKIERAGDLTLDPAQQAAVKRLIDDAVGELMYSSSCKGMPSHLQARRRVARDLESHRRFALRDVARALAISARLIGPR